MTVIEARYVGPYNVPYWGVWFEWNKFDRWKRAEDVYPKLKRQFSGLYEFRMVKV